MTPILNDEGDFKKAIYLREAPQRSVCVPSYEYRNMREAQVLIPRLESQCVDSLNKMELERNIWGDLFVGFMAGFVLAVYTAR